MFESATHPSEGALKALRFAFWVSGSDEASDPTASQRAGAGKALCWLPREDRDATQSRPEPHEVSILT